MSEINQFDKNDIKEICLDEIVYNWEWMISKSGELLKIRVNNANIRYEIDDNNSIGILEPIYGKMAIEKRLLTSIEKVQIRDNPQAFVLYDIIKIRLLLNYLQCMVVKRTFHFVIIVGENQYSNRSQ